MRSKLGIFITMVGLGIAGIFVFLGYQFLTHGFSAKMEPHRAEVLIARQLRHLAIPFEQRNARNPVSLTPDVMKESLAHFADHCAVCHANDGSGETTIGKNVYPKAPDLRLVDTQAMSDGELFWVIHNGIRFTAMPAWGEGDPVQDEGSWKLVHVIRHLPQLTPEELIQMKALNPRTRMDDSSHHH